jgi:hypothetical protein
MMQFIHPQIHPPFIPSNGRRRPSHFRFPQIDAILLLKKKKEKEKK